MPTCFSMDIEVVRLFFKGVFQPILDLLVFHQDKGIIILSKEL